MYRSSWAMRASRDSGSGIAGVSFVRCLTEASYGCHVAAALGTAGTLGIGGSSPTGSRLSPSAVRWGSGEGVVLSTGGVGGGAGVSAGS